MSRVTKPCVISGNILSQCCPTSVIANWPIIFMGSIPNIITGCQYHHCVIICRKYKNIESGSSMGTVTKKSFWQEILICHIKVNKYHSLCLYRDQNPVQGDFTEKNKRYQNGALRAPFDGPQNSALWGTILVPFFKRALILSIWRWYELKPCVGRFHTTKWLRIMTSIILGGLCHQWPSYRGMHRGHVCHLLYNTALLWIKFQ